MHDRRPIRLSQALVLGCALLLWGACTTPSVNLTSGDGVFPVVAGNDEKPRLRYRDGQVSRNETCMIQLKNGLNPKIPPMYVNGEPVGFC